MAKFGYNPIGLGDAAAVAAELQTGDYMAGHVYGWTEFEVDAVGQALTVTTYGVPVYLAADMVRAEDTLARQTPTVVSRFVVRPRP